MLGLILLCLQRILVRKKKMSQAALSSSSAAKNSSTLGSAPSREPSSQLPRPHVFLIRSIPPLADIYAATNASSTPTPTRTSDLTRTFLITIHDNRAQVSSTAEHIDLPIVTELSSALSSCRAQITTLQEMTSLYSQGLEYLSNDLFSCTSAVNSLESASAAFITPTITETATQTTAMIPTPGQGSPSHSYATPTASVNTLGKLTVTTSQTASLIDSEPLWLILLPLFVSPVLTIWALSLTTWEQQLDRLVLRKMMIPSAISLFCFGGSLVISFHGTASSLSPTWVLMILNFLGVGCMTVVVCGWKHFATTGSSHGTLPLRQMAKAHTPCTPQGKHPREASQTTSTPPGEPRTQAEPKAGGKAEQYLAASRPFPAARQVLACAPAAEQRKIDRLPQRDRVAAHNKVVSRYLAHPTQRRGTFGGEECSEARVKASFASFPPPGAMSLSDASKETPPPYGMVPKPHAKEPPFPPSPLPARGLIGDREPRVIASLTRPVATRREVAPENIPLPPESPAEWSYNPSPRGPLKLVSHPATPTSSHSSSPVVPRHESTTDQDWDVDDLVRQTLSELDLDVCRSETSSPELIDYEQERRDQEAWEEAEEEDCRRWEEGDTAASRLLDNWDYLLDFHPEMLE